MIKALFHPMVKYVKHLLDEEKRKRYLQTIFHSKMQEFYNYSKAKRCFIIGNGPSLRISDLDMLKGEDCFACNRIYGLYDKTEWRPKYYCSQDEKVLGQIKDDLFYAVDNSEYAFFPYNFKAMISDKLLKSEKVNLFYKPYVSIYFKNKKYPEGLMPFSSDASEKLYDGLSITYGMIQLAVYMGYKEIYLLGIDHNYPMKNGVVDVKQSYADGIKPIDMSTQFPPELILCEISFREARKYCEENGIVIKNATRGGKLEVFERTDFDLILEND